MTYTEGFRFGAKDEEEWNEDYEKYLGGRLAWQKKIICKLSSLIVQKDEWKKIAFNAYCKEGKNVL